jgi:hypothetical protein
MAPHKAKSIGPTPEYRALDAAMRTISSYVLTPASKARILALAAEWDARTEAHEEVGGELASRLPSRSAN